MIWAVIGTIAFVMAVGLVAGYAGYELGFEDGSRERGWRE